MIGLLRTPGGWLIAAAAAFIITPVASSPFLGDDLFYSTLNGFLAEHHQHILRFLWDTTPLWLQQTARFQPGIVAEIFGIHYVAQGLSVYKCAQVIALVLCTVSYAWLLAEIGLNIGVAGLAVLISLLAVQFHGHFDGYLGFNAQVEDLFILSATSWALFARWLRTGRRWLLAASIVVFIISLLSYEACYLSSIVHALIAVHLRGGRNWRLALPFVGLTAAAFAGLAVARFAFPQTGTAVYRLSLGAGPYFSTLWNEVAASLPLMYLAYFHDRLFPVGVGPFDAVPWWLALALLIVAAAAAFAAFDENGQSRRALILPSAMGVVMWLQPAVLLAAVPRYQSQITPGYGYIFMVFQGFGAGLAIACALTIGLSFVGAKPRRFASGSIAVVYGLTCAVSFVTNERTLKTYEGERAAIINLSAALRDGIIETVPDGSVLYSDSPAQLFHRQPSMEQNLDAFDNPRFFVRQWANRSVRLHDMDLPQPPPQLACSRAQCPAPRAWYGLRDVPYNVRDGFTAEGHLASVSMRVDGTAHPLVDDLHLHVRGNELAELAGAGRIALVYECVGSRSAQRISRDLLSELPRSRAAAVASVRNGVTFALAARCLVDLDTVGLQSTI